jgi:hypothetical protein
MHVPHADPVADGPVQGRAAPTGHPPAAPLARETRRLYRSDWQAFATWCDGAGRVALPADATTVAAFLTAAGKKRSAGTLARRAAAIADQHRRHGLASPCGDHAVTALLRAPRRTGARRRTPSPGPLQLAGLAARCPGDLAGLRDRALLRLAAAVPGRGGLTRTDVLGLTVERLRFHPDGVTLALPADSQADDGWGAAPVPAQAAATPEGKTPDGAGPDGAGATRRLVVSCGASPDRCPVQALRDWLHTSNTRFGPVFRKIDRWGNVEHHALGPDALRRIVARRTRRPPRTRTAPP